MQNPGTEKMGLGVCLEYHQTEKGTGPDSVCSSQYNDSQCTNGGEITVDQIKSESSGDIVVSSGFVEEKSEARLEWDCKERSNGAHQEEQPIPSSPRNGIDLSNGGLLTTRTDSNPYSVEQRYGCNECGKIFPNVAAVTKHMKMHSAEKKYICGQCGKGFTRSEYLKKHQSVHTGEKPHVCSECGQRFTVAGSLKVHMRFHSGEKPYQCTECGMRFFTRATYKNHILNHSGERPNVCGQCGKSFKNAVSLRRHCHSEKPYSCSECGKSFTTLFHLTVHKRVHSGEKPYSCTECGKSFTNRTHLNMHKRIHSGEKPYSCTLCEKSFAQRSGLTVHMRTHSEEKPSKCDHCGKHFKCTYYLKKHLKVHSGEKSQGRLTRTVKTESVTDCANTAYTTIIQNADMNDVSLNARQMKSEHIDPDYIQVAEDPNTQCIDSEKFTEANLESRRRLAIFKHIENSNAMQDLSIVKVGLEECLDSEEIKIETTDPSCDQRHNVVSQFADCDRTGVKCEFSEGVTDLNDFATNSTTEVCNEDEETFEMDLLTPDTKQLSFSRNDHNNQKSYCVNSFQIEQHQQDNSNMNKYGCLDCGKRFKSPSSLKVHKRVHSGEKPYICTECGKSFAQAVHLNIHMRIHSGEKPYSCTMCEKSFAQGSGLTVHMRTHSEEKPSKCDHCGKHFKCMSYLKRHLKVHFRKKSQGRLLMTDKTESDSVCANTANTTIIQNGDTDEVFPNARQMKSEHIDPDYVQMAEDPNTQCVDSEKFIESKPESRGCLAIFKNIENSNAKQDLRIVKVGLEEFLESEQIKTETVDPGYD
ncbi:zinc finger protein 571-like [Brienomyrus brachyistius]|uniref:zinc finger protein 571-like n=1 Tax=Brienomyrus brachyistius TaxID=42636 RepID=UPI0020B379C2|nr:zinc finger protein 571-like [Brienomyrus brachyistius]XP_048834257.1 zinc finger protein 571-like [Brienomyrus brachyistius]